MRLFEIYREPINTKRNYKDTLNRYNELNKDKAGTGHFSSVLDPRDPKRLNQVVKVGQAGRVGGPGPVPAEAVQDDGYLSYLSAIEDLGTAGELNPYFPKFTQLRTYRGPDRLIYFTVKMEKLYPFTHQKIAGNSDLMESIFDSMFERDPRRRIYARFADEIRYALQDAIHGHNLDYIKDENLKQAVDLIRRFTRSGKFDDDLHNENLMWRMTGNFPQLVITDPIS